MLMETVSMRKPKQTHSLQYQDHMKTQLCCGIQDVPYHDVSAPYTDLRLTLCRKHLASLPHSTRDTSYTFQ